MRRQASRRRRSRSYGRKPVPADECPRIQEKQTQRFPRGQGHAQGQRQKIHTQSVHTACCSAASVTGAYTLAAQGDIAHFARTAGMPGDAGTGSQVLMTSWTVHAAGGLAPGHLTPPSVYTQQLRAPFPKLPCVRRGALHRGLVRKTTHPSMVEGEVLTCLQTIRITRPWHSLPRRHG